MNLGNPKLKVSESNKGNTIYLGYGSSQFFRIMWDRDRGRYEIPNTTVDFNLFNFNGVFKAKQQVEYTSRRCKK